MEVTSINYFGSDGWENCTEFHYTPSSQLHIPRVGDTIKNKFGKRYSVADVTWCLETNCIVIDCDLIQGF
jgi:hypothetical protein